MGRKVCSRFYSRTKARYEPDELLIRYSKDSSEDKFYAFLTSDAVRGRRVNVEFTDLADDKGQQQVLNRALHMYKDLAVVLPNKWAEGIVETVKKSGAVNWYFDHRSPACSWTELRHMVEYLGVCDVFVADDLCHCLRDVAEYCHRHDVRLRCALNKVQTTKCRVDKGADAWYTFYLPGDLEVLDEYYDVYEFYMGDEVEDAAHAEDYNRMYEVLYDVWFVNGNWAGDLKEINSFLPISVWCPCMPSAFTSFAANCRYRCVSNGASCDRCRSAVEIANKLKDNGLRFVTN